MYMHCVSLCMHMSTGASRGQKRASDPLEIKLHVVVSCPTWVLGEKLRSSGRSARTLNCWSIPLALYPWIFFELFYAFYLHVLVVDKVCNIFPLPLLHAVCTSDYCHCLLFRFLLLSSSHSVYSLYSRKSKCSSHSSPGKFLFAFVREYYRNHNQSKYRVCSPVPIYASRI